MGCPWVTTGRAMTASAARIFRRCIMHPPNHRCSPKVQTPINRAARGGDSASREGAHSGFKSALRDFSITTCLFDAASLSRTGFGPAVSRPRSPVGPPRHATWTICIRGWRALDNALSSQAAAGVLGSARST
jgi:hypothetical protein